MDNVVILKLISGRFITLQGTKEYQKMMEEDASFSRAHSASSSGNSWLLNFLDLNLENLTSNRKFNEHKDPPPVKRGVGNSPAKIPLPDEGMFDSVRMMEIY